MGFVRRHGRRAKTMPEVSGRFPGHLPVAQRQPGRGARAGRISCCGCRACSSPRARLVPRRAPGLSARCGAQAAGPWVVLLPSNLLSARVTVVIWSPWRGVYDVVDEGFQAFQNDGSGRVQIAHSGCSALTPRTGRSWLQGAQRAQRLWQARHHGSPVALAISAAAKRPQIEHVMSVGGRQLSQRGPSALRALTLRRRPQPTQTSWLAGS